VVVSLPDIASYRQFTYRRPLPEADAFRLWLGARLKEKRAGSLRKIEAESGVSRSTLSQINRGYALPSTETCVRLALYFGEDPEKVVALAGHSVPRSFAPKDDPKLLRLLDTAQSLSPHSIRELESFARFLIKREQNAEKLGS
jgi:transcriptional regulator with XRE-family HTH domain